MRVLTIEGSGEQRNAKGNGELDSSKATHNSLGKRSKPMTSAKEQVMPDLAL
jgi:hypothetical protein